MCILKAYWDLIVGILLAIVIATISMFDIVIIQLCYSVIILMLVSIGLFRLIKKEIDKRRNNIKHKYDVIDKILNSQVSIKAIELSNHPTKLGEDLGHFSIDIFRKGRKTMKSIKTFLYRFRGYIVSICFLALGLVETFSNYLLLIFGNITINGVNVIAVILFLCSLLISMFSNKLTKSQKALLKQFKNDGSSTSDDNKLLQEEITKAYGELSFKLKELRKTLSKKEKEYEEVNKQFETTASSYKAKQSLQTLLPSIDMSAELDALVSEAAKQKTIKDACEKEITTLKQSITDIVENQTKLKSLEN